MYDIKMIVTDFDDTFYVHQPGGCWETENKAALNEARQAGIPVYPCTARPWPQAAKLLADFNFNNLCVTDNGAAVINMDNDEALYQKFMSADTVETLLRLAERYNLVTELCAPRYIGFYTPDINVSEKYTHGNSESMDLNKYGFYHYTATQEAFDRHKDNCLLIRFIYESGEFPQSFDKEVSALTEIEATKSHARTIDVMAKGVNKGEGLIRLSKLAGVDLKHIMALGDAKNDAPMLKIAGLGVAMGDGADETREAADYVSDLAVNGGFAKAVRKFALGKNV